MRNESRAFPLSVPRFSKATGALSSLSPCSLRAHFPCFLAHIHCLAWEDAPSLETAVPRLSLQTPSVVLPHIPTQVAICLYATSPTPFSPHE